MSLSLALKSLGTSMLIVLTIGNIRGCNSSYKPHISPLELCVSYYMNVQMLSLISKPHSNAQLWVVKIDHVNRRLHVNHAKWLYG